jgi:Flp pilus assembly protein TadG
MSWRGYEYFRSKRGSALIEFAFLAPALILLIGGIVEFGRIFYAYKAVNRLATQYAVSWADCYDSPAGTCLTEISLYTSSYSLQNLAPLLNTANVSIEMIQVSMNGTTPSVTYAYPSGSTLTTSQTSLAQLTFKSGQSGVIVTVTYTHTLVYFLKIMKSFLGSYLTPSCTALQLKS